MALGLVGMTVIVVGKMQQNMLRAAYLVLAASLLLAPTVYPWYFVWLLPFLCFFPSAPWLLLSVTAVLGYSPVVAYAAGQPYRDSPFVLALEYVPVYMWLGICLARGTIADLRATF